MADINRNINTAQTNQILGWSPNASAPQQANVPFVQTADVINGIGNYANQFADQPLLANQFKVLGNELTDQEKLRNQIADFYGQFEQSTNPYWQQFMDLNQGVGDEVIGQLASNKQIFDSQYGTQGEQRQRLDSYYQNLGDYLASSSADDLAKVEADSIQSGASLGQRRAASNLAEKAAYDKFIEAKKQEISDYDNLYKTVNTYLDNYVKTYATSKDKYVLETYQKLLDFKNQLGTALVNAQTTLITTGATGGGAGGAGSSAGGTGTGSTAAQGFTGGEGTVATAAEVAAATARPTPPRATNGMTEPSTTPAITGAVDSYLPSGVEGVGNRPVAGAARSTDNAVALRNGVSTAPVTTITPTQRQINDYLAGKSANMSPALIQAIQLYVSRQRTANTPARVGQPALDVSLGYPVTVQESSTNPTVTTYLPSGNGAYRPVVSAARSTANAVARRN